jgi:pimeloyl-ACP methyl ester carboxylesterase
MLTLILAATLAQAIQVSGVVYLDRNANGHLDPGEPGIAGVAVSNQANVVVTDREGYYILPAGGFGVVYVSVPTGYRASGSFWSMAMEELHFGLVATPQPANWSFIHASDTHLDSASLPRTRMVQHLVDSLKPAFMLLTGDLIRDALRVPEGVAAPRFELFMQEKARFSRPVWTAPGNHDIFGIERTRSQVDPTHPLFARGMYRHYLGPDYYSFNAGGIHFVALNTEDIDDQWYYGHVDSLQLAWLERDLAVVPAGTPVVTFNHIPFFTAAEEINGYTQEPPAPSVITVNGKSNFRHVVSNAAALLEVLRTHRYPLALGGHVHIRERLLYELDGQPTRFENAAAIVGPSDGANLHFNSGVTLYRVTNGAIDSGRFIPLPDPLYDASPHEVRMVPVNSSTRLEVLDWGGKGPAMLFLAGLQDPAHEFDDFAPQWTDKFHVYGLTRRGYGASSQPASGYQIDSLITDIRIVLDSLGVDRAILVGHSIAGDELTRFAATWPGRVSKLVYFDGAHDRVPLARMFTETPAPATPPMTRADSLSPENFRAYWRRNSGVQYTMGEVLAIAKFGPDGRYLTDVTPGTIDGAILAGLAHPDYARVQAPALAFYAVTDDVRKLFPFYDRLSAAGKAQADRFNARFTRWAAGERARFRAGVKHGRVVEIRGAHHYIFMSNEAEVVNEMRRFLEEGER